MIFKISANEIHIFSKDVSKFISKHPRLFQSGEESIHHVDFIDIKLRPRALKYWGIYQMLSHSWQEHLNTVDKSDYVESFNVLKHILLHDDMSYADRVLQEASKVEKPSPQMIKITYKRLKENLFTYHQQIDVPVNLPNFTVDVSGYDKFMSKSKNLSAQGGCQ